MDESMIIGTPSQESSRTYTLNHELYLTRDGKVVTRSNTDRATFIGNAGQAIPFSDAVRYGLVNKDGSPTGIEIEGLESNDASAEEEPGAEAKDRKAAPKTKDVKGPTKSK